MWLSDFDFTLPEELIAQAPAARRDASRLLSVERRTGSITSRQFIDIVDSFCPGDVLVVNDTQVIPARLFANKISGGQVEVLLVRKCPEPAGGEDWLCMTRSSKPLAAGTRLIFDKRLSAEVLQAGDDSLRHIRFDGQGDFWQIIDEIGHLPLPPYIKRADTLTDRSRYQTVFAREKGAVAAPTAGLHFTSEILEQIRAKGVEICHLTLHVGPGTFLPVRVEDVRHHKMHAEYYSIPVATAQTINQARACGGRVFAVGTTVTRALETAAGEEGLLKAGDGDSDIFIIPGYRFKIVDALITNFHLPKSTLLMLVSAFAGRELMLRAYDQAVGEKYRFFSYGDCMLIL
ncbi:tRNA preQ1(34) S-adenosylmethionine ribosyltransferase-isomerase QueA [Pelovirga terrestris]|uniref:S-adenosylmethionine:tRNA ribosyltransferase-isomerase n=1 Tax=Pelovirga terrestris TaxID=2771352 RepID=A0A8J6ULC0_9BACT|nr:tRNA preQ1(34) S-adenosylmethionine ribosyltransferase-isomerase QueA [Pelovirga terrestris]MBD1400967.1 tRNA preQ1(34) S-adenosylmethionine ribosyltransferase-isomerase QueA [Pelovirga terrestris]